MLLIGSVVLSILNLAVMYTIAKKHRWSWVAMAVLQLVWVPYDIMTGQLGFLALGAATVWVSLIGDRESERRNIGD